MQQWYQMSTHQFIALADACGKGATELVVVQVQTPAQPENMTITAVPLLRSTVLNE